MAGSDSDALGQRSFAEVGKPSNGLFWVEDKRPVTNPLPPLDAIVAEIASDSAAGLEQFP